jgi:putative DNA methylase
MSSTELTSLSHAVYDLVVTDPPFGGLLHYSELADFFYVWLRLALKDKYPDYFSAEYTPKTLEAVANRARQPGKDEESNKYNADIFYQRLLTACWKEAHRVLKPGGLLAFTFHHSEDAPWVAVLESWFDAGFYLEAPYPIRSDETKGTGEFGSKKIEYDIIHVCRKRMDDPQPISWAKMRRQVLQDVRRLQEMLEHHQEEGLPEADLQVIRRGKALEYFSRHYGKVYKDEGVPINVLEALVGINQLLDEEAGGVKEPPPHNAEPFTRMLLRLFDGKAELARDQMQKFLRGTGSAPSDYVNRGWCFEKKKIFYLTPPLEIALAWIGKHRRGMTSDYDQAAFLIGACFEGSGINAGETLNNSNFRPHPALSALLTWHRTHGATNRIRNAAAIAFSLYRTWESKHQTPKHKQLSLFFSEENE